MADEPVIAIVPHSEVLLLQVQHQRLDEELTTQLQTEVFAAAERARRLPVVLDLSRVDFFPSLSLGALVKLLGEFKTHGQRFILVGLQASVRGALAVTRLDKLFEIHDTVDEAIKQLRLGRTTM